MLLRTTHKQQKAKKKPPPKPCSNKTYIKNKLDRTVPYRTIPRHTTHPLYPPLPPPSLLPRRKTPPNSIIQLVRGSSIDTKSLDN